MAPRQAKLGMSGSVVKKKKKKIKIFLLKKAFSAGCSRQPTENMMSLIA
jgi:hypothetical protein